MYLQNTGITASDNFPDTRYQKRKIENNYKETEREVTSKILRISLKINDQYPELSKYLEKMPVIIPGDKNPEIILKGLSTYYDSLNVLLNYHIKQHPINSTP